MIFPLQVCLKIHYNSQVKKIILILFLLLLTFIQARIYLNSNFPYTHDGQNHLARFANYKIALREGQIPPRFAPNLLHHYGYPVFNYNYPLANLLSVPFSVLKIHPEVTFKILATLSTLFGMLGMWLWLRHFGGNVSSRLFALSTFAIAPYLTKILLYQGNIGELMVMMIIPWLFWAIEELRRNKKHIFISSPILLALFFLSHNVTVLFATPFIITYAILRLFDAQKTYSLKKLPIFAMIGLIGFGLSSWFWIPAIFEKDQTTVGSVNLATDTLWQFPTFHQLIFSPLQFGFSFPYFIDSLSFQLGWIQWIVIILSSIFLLKYAISQKPFNKVSQFNTETLLLIGTVLLIFLQLPLSSVIWNIVPFVMFIQFPWRLTLLLSILLVPLASFVFEKSTTQVRMFLLFVLVLQLFLTLRLQPAHHIHMESIEYDLFTESTSTQNENRAKTFTLNEYQDWLPQPIIYGSGSAQINFWNGSLHQYIVNLSEESTIVEPTMYFLGWKTFATINGNQRIDIEYIFDQQTQGRIAYRLPAGEYLIESRFTQDTPARLIGHVITVLSLIGLGILIRFRLQLHHYLKKFV